MPYLLCVSVARTQLAITAPVLPEDELLFYQSMTGRFDSFRDTSLYLPFIFQVGNRSTNISCRIFVFTILSCLRLLTQLEGVLLSSLHKQTDPQLQ